MNIIKSYLNTISFLKNEEIKKSRFGIDETMISMFSTKKNLSIYK